MEGTMGKWDRCRISVLVCMKLRMRKLEIKAQCYRNTMELFNWLYLGVQMPPPSFYVILVKKWAFGNCLITFDLLSLLVEWGYLEQWPKILNGPLWCNGLISQSDHSCLFLLHLLLIGIQGGGDDFFPVSTLATSCFPSLPFWLGLRIQS